GISLRLFGVASVLHKIRGDPTHWNGLLRWSIFMATGQASFQRYIVGRMITVNQAMMLISFFKRLLCRKQSAQTCFTIGRITTRGEKDRKPIIKSTIESRKLNRERLSRLIRRPRLL